jgi:hypothetical protein
MYSACCFSKTGERLLTSIIPDNTIQTLRCYYSLSLSLGYTVSQSPALILSAARRHISPLRSWKGREEKRQAPKHFHNTCLRNYAIGSHTSLQCTIRKLGLCQHDTAALDILGCIYAVDVAELVSSGCRWKNRFRSC